MDEPHAKGSLDDANGGKLATVDMKGNGVDSSVTTERKTNSAKSKLLIKCEECKSRFKSQIAYENHKKKDKCKQECESCGKVFDQANRQGYMFHLRCHKKKRKDFQCQDCNKIFIRKSHLERHQKANHSGDKPFSCDRCYFSFKSDIVLYMHRLRVHDVDQGRYACPKCPKVYNVIASLDEHLRYKHRRFGEIPDVQCSICGKLVCHRILTKHVAIHRETFDFKCDVCASAFKTLGGLTNHKRIHSKDYSHYCEFCGKGFYYSAKLRLHRRTHTGEKPYVCTVCDYRCADCTNLKRHMQKHGVL